MEKILLGLISSAGIGLILAPVIIRIIHRFKASQTILHYVEAHKSKAGTPTMGGLIFILSTALACACLFSGHYKLALVALGVMCGYGLLGFLDDFIKIKFKQNLGLRAYQKAIGQLGLGLIVALFVYYNPLIGSEIIIPFTNTTIDLGFWIIPFTIFVFLAITNSVNLTDGLDGLASGVSIVYLLIFGIVVWLFSGIMADGGASILELSEYNNILILIFASIGGLVAFMAFNSYPAKIFMGDTGSLALGGLIASVSIFTRHVLLMPILGFVFVWSAVSVIIQVLHYKRTKRRVFLMAPYHHHLEKKGMNETKIVAIYIIITALIGCVYLCFIM